MSNTCETKELLAEIQQHLVESLVGKINCDFEELDNNSDYPELQLINKIDNALRS